jgi:hypothetical protein
MGLLPVIDNLVCLAKQRLDIVREMYPHIGQLMVNKEAIKTLLTEMNSKYTKEEMLDAEALKGLDEFREVLVNCSSKFTDYGGCIYLNVPGVEGIEEVDSIDGSIDKNYKLTDNEAKLLADTLKVTTGSVRRVFLSSMLKNITMYEVLRQLSKDKELFEIVKEDLIEAEKKRIASKKSK